MSHCHNTILNHNNYTSVRKIGVLTLNSGNNKDTMMTLGTEMQSKCNYEYYPIHLKVKGRI